MDFLQLAQYTESQGIQLKNGMGKLKREVAAWYEKNKQNGDIV